ncbi:MULTISPECIES: hypothetical protein [Brachybacterium]|uniref:MmyB family transcriptional regulator n=1 Tax=Brachybacterium TaxID=43668 RepID=UPI00131489D6|nr:MULTISPECIES: hypothetical protein [Brachybacterium]
MQDHIGELSTCSADFRRRWAAHNVRFHRTGVKRLHHPVVGDLTLSFEAMALSSNSEQDATRAMSNSSRASTTSSCCRAGSCSGRVHRSTYSQCLPRAPSRA